MTVELQNVPAPLAVVAAGVANMLTDAVVEKALHPPAAPILYVTVYGPPTVEVEGVTAPVEVFRLNAAGAENEPPVVPVRVTDCADEIELQ